MADQLVGKPLTRTRKHQRRSTIRILEEAVHLLRHSPVRLLGYYYTGSLPFILGLLYFWGDMSRNAFAAEYDAIASLGIALLFVWMKSWQSLFAVHIKAAINNQPDYRFPLRRIFPLVANQTLVHASGFLILPLAALVVIPFGWCFAFYQSATVLEDRPFQDLSTLFHRSWCQAKLWPKQNHILLSVFFIFGIIVFLNLAITLFIFPHLLKKFFGIETVFTLSAISSLNTTFLVATMGLTYLCMDPVVKTAYALRCYYGEAIKSGADIKNQLGRMVRQGKTMVAIMVLTLALSPSAILAEEQPAIPPAGARTPASAVSAKDLDQSIDRVLNQREFAWRLPRQRVENNEEKPGPVASAIKWVLRLLGKCLKTLWRWIEKFLDWLVDILPSSEPGKKSSDASWKNSVRILLILLLVLAGVAFSYFFWRIWQRQRTEPIRVQSRPISVSPDLIDDGLKADELPVNRWLDMAKELMENGSVRLAMRALYLAVLAHLAEHDMITIQAYKSNLDYKHELERRAHEKPELLTAFSTVVTLIERVWYGMHTISQSEIHDFTTTQRRIMTVAAQ